MWQMLEDRPFIHENAEPPFPERQSATARQNTQFRTPLVHPMHCQSLASAQVLLGDGVNHAGAEEPMGLAQDVVTLLAMGLGVNQLKDEDGDAWA